MCMYVYDKWGTKKRRKDPAGGDFPENRTADSKYQGSLN